MQERSNKYCCIIECDDKENNKTITMKNILNVFRCNNSVRYWAILHDKDIKDDSTIKRKHIHLVLIFDFKSCYKQYVIDFLSRELNCSRNIISVDICRDLVISLRYLTHIDNREKYQYKDEEVITNSSIVYYRAALGNKLSLSYLIECLRFTNFNRLKLVDTFITLDEYKRYRDVISDIVAEYGGEYEKENKS